MISDVVSLTLILRQLVPKRHPPKIRYSSYLVTKNAWRLFCL